MRGSWYNRREIDPFSAPVTQTQEFLTYSYYERFQYRTISVHGFAIFSVLPHVNNLPIGQHYLVKIKWIRRENPPYPRYKDKWYVDILLRYVFHLSSRLRSPFTEITIQKTIYTFRFFC
jgi:hypothetical protein